MTDEVLYDFLERASAPSDWDGSWAMACSALWAQWSLARLTNPMTPEFAHPAKAWLNDPLSLESGEPAQPAESPEARALTVWDAEERMAREGDWRGVAYSIAHDILPLVPEGSPDHAYQERARMQIKAADRLTAAVLAASTARPTERGAVERLMAAFWHEPLLEDTDENRVAVAAAIRFALTPPVTVAATDSRITKDWCLNMARLEDGQEIGAGMPDHPLRALEVAATDQAGEVERRAIATFLEACAAVADEQHEKYAGYPAIQRDLKAEAKAYRNVVRMVGNDDHARYRAALATQPATGRTMGGEVWRNDMDTAKHGQNVVLNSDSPLWRYPFVGFWNAEIDWWEFSDPNMAGCFSVSELVNQWLPLPASALQNGGGR